MTDAQALLAELSIDASFCTPAAGGLDYPEPQRSGALLDHLAHAVARRPGDLMAHVRRIRLAAALEREMPLAEALADLFIALDGKGAGLRARALWNWGTDLSSSSRELLERAHANGINANVPLPFRCRLKRGNSGRTDWVESFEAPKVTDASPVNADRIAYETALDLIDSGRLEDACALFEAWLPGVGEHMWDEAAPELARLYRYLENGEERARALGAALQNSHRERAIAWAALLGREGEA